MMNLLQLLWVSSWIGAAAAVAWMVLLILARIIHDRLEVRRARGRGAIVQSYLELMRGDLDAMDRLSRRKGSVPVMAEAFLNVLDMVRGGERERLIESLDAFGFDTMLRKLMKRAEPTAKLAAIEALAAFPGAETEAALRRATHGPGAELRLAAVSSLLTIGAAIDLPELLAEMQRRRDPWSGSMIDTFKLIAERQPGDCATAFGRTDLPVPVRVMLANALGASGDYTILPILAEAVGDSSPMIRVAGIKALGRLMHPACGPVLARGAADPDPRVRAAAAMAIGDTGLTALIPRLVTLLEDSTWQIRFQAAEALARMGAPGRDALLKAAVGGPGTAAEMASLTMAERGLS